MLRRKRKPRFAPALHRSMEEDAEGAHQLQKTRGHECEAWALAAGYLAISTSAFLFQERCSQRLPVPRSPVSNLVVVRPSHSGSDG